MIETNRGGGFDSFGVSEKIGQEKCKDTECVNAKGTDDIGKSCIATDNVKNYPRGVIDLLQRVQGRPVLKTKTKCS